MGGGIRIWVQNEMTSQPGSVGPAHPLSPDSFSAANVNATAASLSNVESMIVLLLESLLKEIIFFKLL